MAEKTFRPHNAFTVGEVFNEKPEEIADFIGENGYFSSMFDFAETVYGKSDRGWYDSSAYLNPEEYKSCIFSTQKKIGDTGMISNIIENHDEPRGVSHYICPEDLCDASKKLLAGVYFMLKGLPFIYQGQEIGMENMKFNSIEDVDDVSTLDEYQVALNAGLGEEEAFRRVAAFSRDNARTPMQWTDGKNAGFTEGTPWLRVNPNCSRINVKDQEKNAGSVLSFYKKLTALRKSEEYKETVVYGEFVPYLEQEKNLIGYFREGEKKLLVLANFQKAPREVELPGIVKKVLLNNLEDLTLNDNRIHLDSWQFVTLEI